MTSQAGAADRRYGLSELRLLFGPIINLPGGVLWYGVKCWLCTACLSHPVNQAHVLLGAAEVFGKVGDAEWLVLTRVNPSLVLSRPRNPVEEDPERLPHGLLANWPNTRTHTMQHLRLRAHGCQELLYSNSLFHSVNYNKQAGHTHTRQSLVALMRFIYINIKSKKKKKKNSPLALSGCDPQAPKNCMYCMYCTVCIYSILIYYI